MTPELAQVVPEVCILKHEIVDTKIAALECEIQSCKDNQRGILDEVKAVRELQTKILYAIIGLSLASALTLLGVVAGRAIDFGVLFP